MFSKKEYDGLHSLVFRSDYSGYKPSVIEIPNGDNKADAGKRYAHVALKYLKTKQQEKDLRPYLEFAFEEACKIANEISNLSNKYYPNMEYGALRVLEYPPETISNLHEDFDLFTLMMYRDQPDKFIAYGDETEILINAHKINPQAHIGQLGEIVGLGKATPHEVLPSDTKQSSIVYFAIPDHDVMLPTNITVRDWLNERMARSRSEFKAYE